jgi:hypothetical protein
LDSLTATTEITIKNGSEVEVAGALYEFQADETESGGTWAGIGANNTVYVYVVPAGSTATFIYSITAPTWDTSKQGWYNGTSRAVVSLYKDAGNLYQKKCILPSWSQPFALPGGVARKVVSTSGALGVLSVTGDTEYILTDASTAIMPISPPSGCRITFKLKTTATSTISAVGGQTMGTTSSISFVLYGQEDYVTFEWDNVSIWYVVATNGTITSSNQTAQTTTSSTGAWTAIGNGLALGSLPAGIYDFEIDCTGGVIGGIGNPVSIAIGNSTTPISAMTTLVGGAAATVEMAPMHSHVRGYVLTAAATIQGIYYSPSATNSIVYNGTVTIGRITARRIG